MINNNLGNYNYNLIILKLLNLKIISQISLLVLKYVSQYLPALRDFCTAYITINNLRRTIV